MTTSIGPRKAVRFYLYEWRIKRDLTQEQLAERMGTSKSKVSKLENGNQEMTGTWMAAAAFALSIEPGDLLHDPDKPTADELLRSATPDQKRLALKLIRDVVEDTKNGTDG